VNNELPEKLAEQSTKVSRTVNNEVPEKLAEQSTELAEQSTELAEQSTKVSSPLVTQRVKVLKQNKLIQIIPPWLNKNTWNDFLEMRRAKKAFPTIRAQELLIKDLMKFRDAGDDPDEVLNKSIKNNWTGIFPLKERQNERTGTNKSPINPGHAPGNYFGAVSREC
jgi:hypothetical protein